MSNSSKSQNKIDLGDEVFFHIIIVCFLIYSKGSIMLLESSETFVFVHILGTGYTNKVQAFFIVMSNQNFVKCPTKMVS